MHTCVQKLTATSLPVDQSVKMPEHSAVAVASAPASATHAVMQSPEHVSVDGGEESPQAFKQFAMTGTTHGGSHLEDDHGMPSRIVDSNPVMVKVPPSNVTTMPAQSMLKV